MTIQFDHVSTGYGGKTVLEDISFSAKSGSITAVIGRNGAGKSTLASCLAGEKRDYRGRITLDGEDLRTLRNGERARRLSYLPQALPHPPVTVRELVSFGRTPYLSLGGRLSAEDRAAVEQALEATGMEGHAGDFVDRLSGGEQKKAFFAMTLAQNTPAILLDEPTAHLDIVSRFAFMDLLTRLKEKTGKAFLVIMHELPEVLRGADHIVAIHQRRVAFQGDAGQCLRSQVPQRCFQVVVTGDRTAGYAVRPR